MNMNAILEVFDGRRFSATWNEALTPIPDIKIVIGHNYVINTFSWFFLDLTSKLSCLGSGPL